jgi:hypothetical protein
MAVLGNASSVVRMVGQAVTFHDRDRLVELRQHPRREQAGDSRAQHHRVRAADRGHATAVARLTFINEPYPEIKENKTKLR